MQVRQETVYINSKLPPRNSRGMWNRTIHCLATKVSDLLYWATGKQRVLVIDPMFFAPVNACFRRRILASPMWTTRAFAERMATKCGVSPHASVISGRYEIDPSYPREALLTGYSDMCLAVARSYWWCSNTYLTIDHFETALLPEGWVRLSEEERLALEVIFSERAVLREYQLEMYRANTQRYHMRSQLEERPPPAEEECPICFELATDCGPWVALRVCGHQFHSECVLRLVQPTCPLCRAVIVSF